MTNNNLKKEKKRIDLLKPFESNGFVLSLCFFILVATLVAYMYIRNAYDTHSGEISQLTEQCERMKQEVISLQSEVLEISRQTNIRKIAHEQLGMVTATPEPITIFIKKQDNE